MKSCGIEEMIVAHLVCTEDLDCVVHPRDIAFPLLCFGVFGRDEQCVFVSSGR